MFEGHRKQLLDLLALHPNWNVLDIGGWEQPILRADWVIDIRPYETSGSQGVIAAGNNVKDEIRFDKSGWVIHDMCDTPWPFKDKAFDFVICSNVLEDVRDPIAVCKELSRVGKSGYIEVPRVGQELKQGVDLHWGGYGYLHHRWIVKWHVPILNFLQKLTITDEMAVVAKNATTGFEPIYWRDQIRAREIFYDGDENYIRAIKTFCGVNNGN